MKKGIRKKLIDHETFFKLFDQFIKESSNGMRTKANGQRIKDSTIMGYVRCKTVLIGFCSETGFRIQLYLTNTMTTKELLTAKRYWKKFETKFVNYLLDKRDCYDNYVGTIIKRLKVVLNYLINNLNYPIARFHLKMYAPNEEISFIVLSPDQLKNLIHDSKLESLLTKTEKRIKDIFVFGCSVGLRISDLMSLSKEHIQIENEIGMITVRSQKTGILTRFKLPNYALDIIRKYENEGNRLLPQYCVSYIIKNLKSIGEKIYGDQEYIKTRRKKGVSVIVYKKKKTKEHFKMSDMISTHTMRRTGITSMLRLGVPELLVRKYSGHSQNSKDFYRYVQIAESHLNQELEKAFDFLSDN